MVEGIDFYLNDEGFIVFTETYHNKRGYCCKNKCKHCPWGFGKVKPGDSKDDQQQQEK
jgi:hypothetical protein